MELFNQIISILADFTDPRKRVFIGYLFLSLFIAFVWLVVFKRINSKIALIKIFDKKIFFSKSAQADYKIFIINRVISLFISPLLLTQIAIATGIYLLLHQQGYIQSGYFSSTSTGIVVLLFTLFMFFIDDFSKYLVHRWMHKFHFLWAIHKVHHSAETLTPITVYRVHPLEGILYTLRSAVSQGLAISIFIFLFGSSVDLYTIVGVNVLVFIFHITGSNLRHSHISISYWSWLEYILISPAQHQLHHSIAKEHHDKNYGAALAVWDWIFGSLYLSDDTKDLKFGLKRSEASSTNLIDIYIRPFLDIKKIILKAFKVN